MTPTTDTNRPGRCRTHMDSGSTSSQATDSAGHFGHALQAVGQGSSPPSSTSERDDMAAGRGVATGTGDALNLPPGVRGSPGPGGYCTCSAGLVVLLGLAVAAVFAEVDATDAALVAQVKSNRNPGSIAIVGCMRAGHAVNSRGPRGEPNC